MSLDASSQCIVTEITFLEYRCKNNFDFCYRLIKSTLNKKIILWKQKGQPYASYALNLKKSWSSASSSRTLGEEFHKWQLNLFLCRVLIGEEGGEFLTMSALCNSVWFELQNFLSASCIFFMGNHVSAVLRTHFSQCSVWCSSLP